MNIKEFVEKNAGKDKLVGEPIRLNAQKLKVKKDKDYAVVVFWGDVHIGYPTCNLARAKEAIDLALQDGCYVLAMGDLLESGLTTSIGNSVYTQLLNPQEQMEAIVSILEPVAKAGLLLGIHAGNHEERIAKATGIDITKLIARMLNAPYLGCASWSALSLEGVKYSIYSIHGYGGARFKHSRLKSALDMVAWISADILAMGHTHSMASESITQQYYCETQNKIIEREQYVCLSGSYIQWDGSYGQAQGYPINKIGSPTTRLYADEKRVLFSL